VPHSYHVMDGSSQSNAAGLLGDSPDARARSTRKFLLPIVALTAIYSIGLSVSISSRLVMPEESSRLYLLLFGLFLTWWVRIDRLERRFVVPFEFDVLVWCAWPFMVPYYLYRTRGWKGILLGIAIWGLYFVPVVVAATVGAFMFR
jgi:hypothetical protein